MAELATVARPYAEALFRVAQSGDLNLWSELVSELAQLGSHPEVLAMAANPNLTHSVVQDTLLALVKSKVSNEATNFIEMLVVNGRVSLLPEIGTQFLALKNAQEGSADAHITSAFELSSGQVAELVTGLEKKFMRKLNPNVSIDSSLIGGVRVVVGDQILDTSVRAKLQQMQIALTS